MSVRLLIGDCRERLRELDDGSVHTCVTSPPYFGLRDYGHAGQIGLEETPDAFIQQLVEVFREVRRVLRDDGTLWLNLGDSYANDGKWGGSTGGKHVAALHGKSGVGRRRVRTGLKPKDLIGMPWRVAFALQADGWFLRRDIVWHKLNPMPEAVRDRPTTAHEFIFLLTKEPQYYYDADAIREPVSGGAHARKAQGAAGGVTPKSAAPGSGIKANSSFHAATGDLVEFRNKRSVWTVGSEACREAHFATYPPELIEPCILAGCPKGGTVLDPFGGAGTTGLVADRLGRNAVLIELNPEYAAIASNRLNADAGMFAAVEAA